MGLVFLPNARYHWNPQIFEYLAFTIRRTSRTLSLRHRSYTQQFTSYREVCISRGS